METPTDTTARMATSLRAAWAAFCASRGRFVTLTAAALVVALFAVLPGIATRSSCGQGPVEVACPTDPVGPDGRPVSDRFFFANRPLGENGSITARLTSMSGIITYPPPNHDEIVPGLVPWAKAGIIIKDGVEQGSAYAALMMTGSHGVRMQHNYVHDVAGRPGGVSAEAPRWLRLTRSGDTITGDESADGARWTKVGTARLAGLPATVRVGLFAASPGDLTLRRVGLGGRIAESRFTQATGAFDHVTLDGQAAAGEWSRDPVGGAGHTDWEKYHRAAGLVEVDGTLTVTGSGDIGPIGTEAGTTVESTLAGLAVALIPLIVMAVRFATAGDPSGRTGSGRTGSGRTGAAALGGRALVARAVVVGAVTFLTGLVAAAVAVGAGTAILRGNGVGVIPVGALTGLRVVVGAAGLVAVAAVFALALGALLRRTWAALLVALSTVVLAYLLGVLPFLPEGASDWLLRLTPAAGFAILQTLKEYPQVTAHYAPSAGYYPLPGWTGCAILCAYAAVALWLAARRPPRRAATAEEPVEWR